MRRSEVEIVNRLGLHARAAAQLVRLAGKFESEIVLSKIADCITANAKSILSVLTLSASIGSVLVIEVNGVDEDEAHDALKALFASGFGELD